MNEPRTIKGRWWIKGCRKKPHFGTLQFSPTGGIELEVSIAERMSLLDIVSGKPGRNRPIQARVHGEDQKRKPVTLFGCEMIERSSPGPFLELFALFPREGWVQWGSEAVEENSNLGVAKRTGHTDSQMRLLEAAKGYQARGRE